MKLYVDEFPKDCIDCPCESEYYCNLLHEDVGCLKWGEIHKNCPLQSLAEHDKQVRKEVLQEVKVSLREKIRLMQSDEHCYPENAIDWHTIVDTIKLIQGE